MGQLLVQSFEDSKMDQDLVRRLSEKARLASGQSEGLQKERAERMKAYATLQAEKAKSKVSEIKAKVVAGAENMEKSIEENTRDIKKQTDHASNAVKDNVLAAVHAVQNPIDAGNGKAEQMAQSVKGSLTQGKELLSEQITHGETAVMDQVENAKKGAETAIGTAKEHMPTLSTMSPHNDPYPRETLPVDYQRPRQLDASPQARKVIPTEPYTAPLPLGFEPPPGYAVLKASSPATSHVSKPPAPPSPPPLPLVAPTISEFSASEPVLGQLAGTIDALAQFLNDSPSAIGGKEAREVLEVASLDLQNLGQRLEAVKEDERKKLESILQEKTKEYNTNLVSAERELVEKLEKQEEDWKSAFDSERKGMVSAYREKLEGELSVQKELIEQRLKEEIVAQGIEMQRRWLREISDRVEAERSGRLGKLETLQEDLDKLGKTTLENDTWLEGNREVNRLWTAVRAAWQASVDSSKDSIPFAKELQALENVARKSPTTNGYPDETSAPPLLDLVLSSIPEFITHTGIDTFSTLAAWFSDRLVPKIRKAALLPTNGGFISYLSSAAFSNLLFQKVGFVQGDDVISTLSRAEWYLTHRDLESAAREINQLTGWPKILARDWLVAARRHLEVKQALEVAEAEAGLASLLSL